MELQRTYGLIMDLPEGKLPGFYAQLIKTLAAEAPLWDRDKDMLIYADPQQREAAYPVMQRYKLAYEEVELLLLPDSLRTEPLFTDYGWITRSGNAYVFADAVFLFQLLAETPQAESEQALLQLKEHVWASFTSGAEPITTYVTDVESQELMERIAQAYRCRLKPVVF